MKKLDLTQMQALQGGICVTGPGQSNPPVGCPGMCMASLIVFLNTGHGLGGPDGFVCIA